MKFSSPQLISDLQKIADEYKIPVQKTYTWANECMDLDVIDSGDTENCEAFMACCHAVNRYEITNAVSLG